MNSLVLHKWAGEAFTRLCTVGSNHLRSACESLLLSLLLFRPTLALCGCNLLTGFCAHHALTGCLLRGKAADISPCDQVADLLKADNFGVNAGTMLVTVMETSVMYPRTDHARLAS